MAGRSVGTLGTAIVVALLLSRRQLGVAADEWDGFVPFSQDENVFSLLAASTDLGTEGSIGSTVALEYSMPLMVITEKMSVRFGPVNLTEEHEEVRFLRSHAAYLSRVRTALEAPEDEKLTFKCNCTYEYGRVICVLMHLRQPRHLILSVTYVFDDPPADPAGEQQYYRRITSTEQGDRIREMFLREFAGWELFERIHRVMRRWREVHALMIRTCTPDEMLVHFEVAFEPEPTASCRVQSLMPVPFRATIRTPDGSSSSDTSRLGHENGFEAAASVAVTPRPDSLLSCVVSSLIGWESVQQVRLKKRGDEYAFEEVPIPWNSVYPRDRRGPGGVWALVAYVRGLHPSTVGLLVLVGIIVGLRAWRFLLSRREGRATEEADERRPPRHPGRPSPTRLGRVNLNKKTR